ncbi:MAG TPA: CstA-like transporter-associated (seleno)protein [Gemmatimonadales bacterium]|nr:CstA-like transporter-associated (seleno)protein [Gemmatimonadales bacterium]
MRRVIERLVRALRRVVGAPDYEAYLEHCRRAGHPPRLDEKAYVREFFETKGGRVRCC